MVNYKNVGGSRKVLMGLWAGVNVVDGGYEDVEGSRRVLTGLGVYNRCRWSV